jgi:uncharacterized protein YprB with RNaseH-like and TPR domain
MKRNLFTLRKDELHWLMSHNCKHGHSYLEHIQCFEQEGGPAIKGCIIPEETIGFFDIEASNLNADFGYIISYCMKEMDGDISGYCISPKEVKDHTFDKNLVQEMLKDFKRFDRIVVYFGSNWRFDVPFTRTRALHWGYDFPIYRERWVEDCYNLVRQKLKLHRNRLETACEYFEIPAKQHRLNPTEWQRAMAGCKEALDYIYEHNKEDVISLEMLWKKLKNYGPRTKGSI